MNEPTTIEVRRDVRDGVPVFWTPSAPTFTGALMFRAGVADETPITHGIAHLAEHLALFPLGSEQPYAFNGFVDGLRTTFHATGTPDEVTAFLSSVCAAIAAPPAERLEAESRVLRAEAARRAPGSVECLLWYRYGPGGHGLLVCKEHALDAPDPAALRRWMAERFTVENAAAWFSGPIPDGVSFAALPHGRRMPTPEPAPLAGLKTPAFVTEVRGGITMSFVAPREDWISVPFGVVTRRLVERLRFKEGLSYEVGLDTRPVGSETMHGALYATCLDEHLKVAEEGLMQVVEEFARDGPTPDELRRLREEFGRAMTGPESVGAHLDPAALNELLGYPGKGWAELAEELEAFTPERCAAIVRRALETALLMLPPGGTSSRATFTPYPAWSSTRVQGRRFRSSTDRFPWSRKGPSLIVGAEGVSVVTSEGQAMTVLFEECRGAVVDARGDVYLVGHDCTNFWLRPVEWHDGEHARDSVVAALPAAVTLRVPRR